MTEKAETNLAFYESMWQGRPVDPTRWPSARALRPHIRGRVVEVGPGLCPRSPAPQTLFVEPSPSAVARLSTAGRAAQIGTMEQLPVGDGEADTLIAFDVLEHCDDDERALTEVARVLSDGGTFILAVPLGQRYFSPLDRLVGHTFRYAPEVLLDKLARHGFSVVVGRVNAPRFPWTKRLTDRLQLGLIHALGLARATRWRATAVRLRPRWLPGLRLGPVAPPLHPHASRATLVCRRISRSDG